MIHICIRSSEVKTFWRRSYQSCAPVLQGYFSGVLPQVKKWKFILVPEANINKMSFYPISFVSLEITSTITDNTTLFFSRQLY